MRGLRERMLRFDELLTAGQESCGLPREPGREREAARFDCEGVGH